MRRLCIDEIPVFPNEYGDGRRDDFPFVDLRAQPKAIGQVDEVHCSEPLAALLRMMNARKSPLMTFACSYEHFGFDEGDANFGARHRIGLTFSYASKARRRSLSEVARLAEGVVSALNDSAFMEYEPSVVRPLERAHAWAVGIDIAVGGTDDEDAKRAWTAQASVLANLLIGSVPEPLRPRSR